MDTIDVNSYRRRRESPSFSSTLLDAIYRSIDQGEEDLVLYNDAASKKQAKISLRENMDFFDEEQQSVAADLRLRMEKRMREKLLVSRKSEFHSSSSSSDSSSCGGFSSSEAESVYGSTGYLSSSVPGIRTIQHDRFSKHEKENNSFVAVAKGEKTKHEGGGFVKTKSRALKMYSDLKKAKQPISPGGRLASFLNSLFAPGNSKKAKISISSDDHHTDRLPKKSKSAQASTCSSASSFSRSCLSKTPSSREKPVAKRSVQFYPVSIILDEDCQPCGHKSVYEDYPDFKIEKTASIREEVKVHLSDKSRRVEEAARDLLRKYQEKVEREFNMRNANDVEDEDMDDDDDDVASCASSDLFELDSIGIERYREELPVYGTTKLHDNGLPL